MKLIRKALIIIDVTIIIGFIIIGAVKVVNGCEVLVPLPM